MYCISCQVSSQHFSHNSILSLDIMLVSYVDKVGLGRNDHLEGKTEIPGESCLACAGPPPHWKFYWYCIGIVLYGVQFQVISDTSVLAIVDNRNNFIYCRDRC